MLTVNTNMGALIAANQLNRLNGEYEGLKEQATTGKRINSAKDDAAGMAILMGMQSQFKGNQAALGNISRGEDLLGTKEAALGSLNGMMLRLKELATGAADGTMSDADRAKSNAEAQSVMEEMGRIASTTEYNGIKLLDGSVTSVDLQVGGRNDADSRIGVGMFNASMSEFGIDGGDLSSAANAQTFLDNLELDIGKLAGALGNVGAVGNRLEFAREGVVSANEGLQKSMSSIEDADMAKVSADLAKNEILQQLGYSMMQRSNAAPQSYLSLFA